MTLPRISEVTYARANPADRERGLLGFISVVLGGAVRLDGLALRRSARGALYVGFPAKGPGRAHPYIAPTSAEARRDLEQAILTSLGVEEPTP